MDILKSGIPDIKIRKIGTKRYSYEIIETRAVLKAWDGYLNKHWENGKEITDGKITLNFGVYNRDVSRDWRTQINAYHYLLQNQFEIRDSIIRSLTEKFEWLKATYDWDQDDDFTLQTKAGFDFKPFIGPASVSFDDEESKDGISYLEWHFNCDWDSEHGLAVITHEARVIDLDRGETDIWKIYEDNGTLAEKQMEYDERTKNLKPKSRKPWWKFW